MVDCAGLENRDAFTATPEHPGTSESGGNPLSPSLLLALENHPELSVIISAWPALPEPLRAGILAMVNGATGKA